MATVSTVLNFSRAQAQTDSNGITDANGIVFANEAKLDYRRKLLAAGVDASQTQESYKNATAGTGTYLWPPDMFWLKTLEVNLGSSNAQDYKTATQIDVSNIPGNSSFSYLRANQNRDLPLFDDRGDQFEVFPTPASSDNLSQTFRIFYFLEPDEYASTADPMAYPESLDYRIIGLYICGTYFQSLGKFEEAQFFFGKYEERVKDIISTLSRGSQQPIQATGLQIDGWQF